MPDLVCRIYKKRKYFLHSFSFSFLFLFFKHPLSYNIILNSKPKGNDDTFHLIYLGITLFQIMLFLLLLWRRRGCCGCRGRGECCWGCDTEEIQPPEKRSTYVTFYINQAQQQYQQQQTAHSVVEYQSGVDTLHIVYILCIGRWMDG